MAASETIDVAQLRPRLDALVASVVPTSYEKPLRQCAQVLKADMRENFIGSHAPDGTPWPALRHPRPSGQGNDQPLRDKGILMASTTATGGKDHVEQLTAITLEIGTADYRAHLHQHGGILRPVKAKALTIPLTKEAARVRGPRDFPPGKLFVVGRFLVEEKQKGRGKKQTRQLIRHFLFVDQVTIPARPFVGISSRGADTCAEILGDWTGQYFLGTA